MRCLVLGPQPELGVSATGFGLVAPKAYIVTVGKRPYMLSGASGLV